MSIRVRYAPSPTGELHLGSLRTIIFDYLFAKGKDGQFLMRVEDTDQARLVEGAVQRQLQAMQWMGIVPDEGVYLDSKGEVAEKGEYGPYTQSKRLAIYKEQAEQLIEHGSAYRCFCSAERLTEMRAEQQAQKQAPRYDRRCRGLSKMEVEQRIVAGESYVVRQAIPESGQVEYLDLIRGPMSFQATDLDDQVLLKSDGFPTYHLASVVDDHLMRISHVLRGEEWLPSTPKNLLLYQAFGWEAPFFAHLPVILGPDGKHKLSKRDGDVSVIDYKERGYLPEALFNVLAFLGWSPGTEEEFFSVEELIKRFQLERVQKAAAVFNFERLDFVNGWYIRHLPISKVVEYMLPRLLEAELVKKEKEGYALVNEIKYEETSIEIYLKTVAGAVQERLKHFDETVLVTRFFFERPEVSPELLLLLVPKKASLESTLTLLQESTELLKGIKGPWEAEEVEAKLYAFIEKNEYKKGEVLWPIRVALTGVPASPGAFEMLLALGKEEALERLQAVLEVA